MGIQVVFSTLVPSHMKLLKSTRSLSGLFACGAFIHWACADILMQTYHTDVHVCMQGLLGTLNFTHLIISLAAEDLPPLIVNN